MVEFLTPLIDFIGREQATVQIMVTLSILIIGHLGAKFVKTVGRRLWVAEAEITKKELIRRQEALQYTGYIIDASAISVALLYLNTGITREIVQRTAEFAPRLLSAMLIAVLGLLVIQIVTRLGENFLRTMGIQNYLREIGVSHNGVRVISGFFKAFLYLILLQISLDQLGVGDSFVRELITASSWAAAFLIAGLMLYGFKDLIENFAAGIYLKSSRLVKPGEKVYLDDDSGEIRSVDLFSTEIGTGGGYNLVTQNKNIMDADLKFKRSKGDLDTLEDIKKYFTAQDPSYCGPASAEMALNIFGYRFNQNEIGAMAGTEKGVGTMPEDIIEVVEELTDEEVKGAYIEYDKVTDLSDEFKTWFNDGALIIPNFAKPVLFPQANTAHYSLCVAVEGDELLIVDPSADTVSGGVYYADSSEMLEAMGEFEGRTRGYVVLAPEDTTAYWRINEGLIYSDENLYDHINKNMELQLRRILRQGRILKNVLPDQLEDYLEKWEKDEKVGRVWKPEEGGEEDEDTDNS